jgi:hypothetical protein
MCNNNILTIEKFHKNRCAEKNKIRDILIDLKHDKDKYKEVPIKEVECTSSICDIKDSTLTINPSLLITNQVGDQGGAKITSQPD